MVISCDSRRHAIATAHNLAGAVGCNAEVFRFRDKHLPINQRINYAVLTERDAAAMSDRPLKDSTHIATAVPQLVRNNPAHRYYQTAHVETKMEL